MNVFDKYPSSKLVGISGTFCAGKDTAANHLVDEYSFMHVSTGDVLRAKAAEHGRDITDRNTLIEVGVEPRKRYGGLGALVIIAIEQWESDKDNFLGGLVVSGLRLLGESEEIQKQNGRLVFVDAPEEVRYKRLKDRARMGDAVHFVPTTFDEFVASEQSELHGLGGPERPNLRAVERISDIIIQNNGTQTQYLYELDETLGLLTTASNNP